MTLAKLNASDTLPLEHQTLDIIDLVTEIIDDCQFESTTKNVTINYQGLTSFIAAVNGELIYRAIENVIRNAVKYSPSGCHVDVVTVRRATAFEIAVMDRGPGVPQQELKSIFRPFKRSNPGEQTEFGFGLGLAIAQRALNVHGGEVHANLNRYGGLSVTLSLPLKGAEKTTLQ